MREIVIPFNPWKTIVVCMGLLIWSLASLFSPVFYGYGWKAFGCLLMAGFLTVTFQLIRRILKDEPAVILSDRGIFDSATIWGGRWIGWDEVKKVRQTNYGGLGFSDLPWFGMGLRFEVETKKGLFIIPGVTIENSLDQLKYCFEQRKELKGKITVSEEYKNYKASGLTSHSFWVTVAVGVALALSVILGVVLGLWMGKGTYQWVAFIPPGIVFFLIFRYYPVSFNTRKRNQRPIHWRYILPTAAAMVVSFWLSGLFLSCWVEPREVIVIGAGLWFVADRVIRMQLGRTTKAKKIKVKKH